jgi:Double zinc ribbon
MTTPSTCPACGASASGNFCSACGASLAARACAACRAELSSQARFCHRCGTPAGSRSGASDRRAWLIAGALCVLLVGGIAYRVSSSAPQPATPDMANTGASPGDRAPDISGMSPRERFDRLFNRIMQAAERGEAAEVEQFTPMALGAYQQLDTIDVDARYHAAVIHLQTGNIPPARALADTILAEAPGHLFGFLIRGTAAGLDNDRALQARAERDFLASYPREIAANRVEYLEHRPVLDEFRRQADSAAKSVNRKQ